jgi:hypothetical protein
VSAVNTHVMFANMSNWLQRKGPPTNIVYESQANLADHQKIKGTEEGLHKMGH